MSATGVSVFCLIAAGEADVQRLSKAVHVFLA